uniref:Hypothetical secreted protein n=1 Tax=Simulium nigrimanum TaxID=683695 RepID=D1FPX1_SIMNI
MKSFGLPTATFLLSLLIADGEPVINSVTEMVKNILRNHCKMTSATVATDNGKKVVQLTVAHKAKAPITRTIRRAPSFRTLFSERNKKLTAKSIKRGIRDYENNIKNAMIREDEMEIQKKRTKKNLRKKKN